MFYAKSFPDCLQDLMKRHQLTVGLLGKRLGGSAELKHALADELTEGKRSVLCNKLCSLGIFEPEECESLLHSLEVSRIGAKRYASRRSIAMLLKADVAPNVEPILLGDGHSLADSIERIKDADEIELLCINCCYPALFTILAPLFSDQHADVNMRHYIRLDSYRSDAARFVSCVSPILFDSRYHPYGMVYAHDARHDVNGNLLCIHTVRNGERDEAFYVFVNAQLAYALPTAADAKLFPFFNRILSDFSVKPMPLKEMQNAQIDYANFCMLCLSRELNRSTYSLGSSIAFQQTPTEIALAAFNDKAAFPPEIMERLSKEVIPIHEQRFQNIYHKKKAGYSIYTLDGCRAFLETGASTDHFFGFRSFTPTERLLIFSLMLEAAKENKYFIPLLLKEPSFHCKYFIICYDKLGVALTSIDTDYRLGGGYSHVFLTFPEFTGQYTDYFLNDLVKNDCYSREESMCLLTELYHEFEARFQSNG